MDDGYESQGAAEEDAEIGDGETLEMKQPKKTRKQRRIERLAAINETEERIKILKKWKEKLRVLLKNMARTVEVTRVDETAN